MKTMTRLLTYAVAATISMEVAEAALNIPSDGSDGALVITNNTVIDLGQAVTGTWSDPGNGKGIYDSNYWAVVFKYSSVVVSNGATVTFTNHPSRAPVVWLVSGDVTINGTVSLDGQAGVIPPNLAEPGPGGFRGGFGALTWGVGSGAGFGPAGGRYTDVGGSYGSLSDIGGETDSRRSTYGNPSLLPLIGGSGGGGDYYNDNCSLTSPQSVSGGGGGGAILVACSGTLAIGATGVVSSNGGGGGTGYNNQYSGGGSGGGVRLVCATLSGSGIVRALVGDGYFRGGLGRIRIERVTNASSIQVTPDPVVVPLQPDATPLIWLPPDGPTAAILSISGVNAPADPRASFGAGGPDVSIPQATNAVVVIATTNVVSASTVQVRVTPRANGDYTVTTATCTATNSTSPLVLLWTANVPVNPGNSAVQVKVVRP